MSAEAEGPKEIRAGCNKIKGWTNNNEIGRGSKKMVDSLNHVMASTGNDEKSVNGIILQYLKVGSYLK